MEPAVNDHPPLPATRPKKTSTAPFGNPVVKTPHMNRLAARGVAFQRTMRDYYQLITGLDREVGRIMEKLSERGLSAGHALLLSGHMAPPERGGATVGKLPDAFVTALDTNPGARRSF